MFPRVVFLVLKKQQDAVARPRQRGLLSLLAEPCSTHLRDTAIHPSDLTELIHSSNQLLPCTQLFACGGWERPLLFCTHNFNCTYCTCTVQKNIPWNIHSLPAACICYCILWCAHIQSCDHTWKAQVRSSKPLPTEVSWLRARLSATVQTSAK